MGVVLRVGDRSFELGSPGFLHAFFSTIAVRVEGDRWGSRYPTVMNDLYGGSVEPASAEVALRELDAIRKDLSGHGPHEVVWDFEDRSARPPWGNDIATSITSLADYFVTSDGRDLIDTLRDGLHHSVELGQVARVE